MGEHTGKRRRRVTANEIIMSCPFRKRNPTRFNVRSHSSCALSDFPSMTHLKRHIKAFHLKSGEGCRRCGTWFETTEDLFDHLNRPTVCTLGTWNRNPEDGISHADLQKLCDKKVQTWNDVWLVLFPDLQRDIPYPGEICDMDSRNLPYRFALTQVVLCVDFDPPVELDE
ncbi:hypothetical protein F5883DRAFT_406702, partial [Diaporthe sp. PMI_573]